MKKNHTKILFKTNYTKLSAVNLFMPTRFEFYIANNPSIIKYSYSDGTIALVWSVDIPELVDYPDNYISDLCVLKDGTVYGIINGGFDTGRPSKIYEISNNGELVNESINIQGLYEGGFKLTIDYNEEYLYALLDSYPSAEIAKLDRSLNILNKISYNNAADFNPITTSSGRLFIVENNINANVYELKPSDLTSLNNIELGALSEYDMERTRNVTIDKDNNLVVAVSGDFNQNFGYGYITILNQDLTIQKVLNAQDIGFRIDGGSGTTSIACTKEGYIATCNTANNGIYLIDPETEQVLWSHVTQGSGTLSSSRPTEIYADYQDNIIVRSGLGNDPRYIIIYDIDGNLLRYLTVSNSTCNIHYENWILNYNNLLT